MEQRPLLELKTAVLRAEDLGAGEIGGQQVGRELHAMEVAFNRIGEDLDGAGLGQTGRALDQQVAVAEQGDQQAVDQTGLADDVLIDVVGELLKLRLVRHGAPFRY